MRNKHFEIKPSNILRNWIIFIHLFVLFIILIMPVSKLFCLLVFLSYFFSKNINNTIKSFKHDRYDQWYLYTQKDEQIATQLLKNNYISDFLLILRFSDKHTLILFSRQFSPADWRAMQMILRN